MTPKQRWEKIAQFKFPDHFRELLCKKLDWQMSSAQNAIIEYKKFMYLATYSPVTPSLVIDEVWHLHIQWTSLYAEFCQDIYSDNFCHHLPEFLPPQDGISDFQSQYYETLKLYYCEFNCHPPKSIWSYNLKEGVKLKLEGRAIPLSAEPFWKTIPFLLSPVFNQAVIKARTKQYSSSSFILNQDVNQKKVLTWEFPEGFADRLAREQGWSKIFAEEATLEYLKFHWLKLKGVETISSVLEQVWLLHLLATKNYLHFSRMLGFEIIPHLLNQSIILEWSKLSSEYKDVFGYPPPSQIWKV